MDLDLNLSHLFLAIWTLSALQFICGLYHVMSWCFPHLVSRACNLPSNYAPCYCMRPTTVLYCWFIIKLTSAALNFDLDRNHFYPAMESSKRFFEFYAVFNLFLICSVTNVILSWLYVRDYSYKQISLNCEIEVQDCVWYWWSIIYLNPWLVYDEFCCVFSTLSHAFLSLFYNYRCIWLLNFVNYG